MPEYQIKKLEPGEFELLIPLMKDCFGAEVNAAYFDWKFSKNPAGDLIGFVALTADNEVASYYGSIPQVFSLNGQKQIIYQTCDLMTHSRHRRKGLFQLLANHCYNYLKEQDKFFLTAFGGDQSTPGFLKFGWQNIADVVNYFYPRQFLFISGAREPVELVDIQNAEEIESLIESSNAASPVHAIKKIVNYKWRISNPKYQYFLKAVKNNGVYTGYMCYYFSEGKIFLFDFYAKTKDTEIALFNYLKNELRQRKEMKGIISFCQHNGVFAQILKNNGFIKNPFKRGPLTQKSSFILFSSTQNMQLYNDPKLWDIRPYDHDAL
ncbi:MAG: family N-acetyltransferase [Bacteroidota bacterium]|nr:family N-acetyltransferase [Bacteroidota bacterium]